jgi:acetoin utilization deacetylase AcuC-like enzyme
MTVYLGEFKHMQCELGGGVAQSAWHADVHQGNGTAEIFDKDERMITFDMYVSSAKCSELVVVAGLNADAHANSSSCICPCAPCADSCEGWAAVLCHTCRFCEENYPWKSQRPASINVPLSADTSDEAYLQTLHAWLPQLAKLKPDLVFLQAGVDPLVDDKLGKMQISRQALNARNNMLYSFALFNAFPMVITMGGGYAKPSIDPSVAAHADVYRTAALRLSAFQAQ